MSHKLPLFIGGELETVGGQQRGRLAKVDAHTGAVDAAFRFDISGSTRSDSEPFGPKYLGVTPDGILVIAHRARFVNQEARTGVALVDTASDTLLGWSTDFWGVNAVTTIVDTNTHKYESYQVGPEGEFKVMEIVYTRK